MLNEESESKQAKVYYLAKVSVVANMSYLVSSICILFRWSKWNKMANNRTDVTLEALLLHSMFLPEKLSLVHGQRNSLSYRFDLWVRNLADPQ